MIRIREKFETYLKAQMHTKDGPFSVLRNPTTDELKQLRKEEYLSNRSTTGTHHSLETIGFYLRALIVDQKDVLVWYGDWMSHQSIVVEMKLQADKDLIPLIFYLNEDCKIEEINYSVSIKEMQTLYANVKIPELTAIIKKNPIIKAISAPDIKYTMAMDY